MKQTSRNGEEHILGLGKLGISGIAALAFVAGLCATPVAVLLVALTGHAPTTARSEPPAWEVAIGQAALSASLQRRASQVRLPEPTEAQLLQGLELYRQNCSGCHGGARHLSSWGMNDFYPRVPQFSKEQVRLTQEQAYVAVRDGIRYSGMAGWKDQLSDQEIRAVAAFVARMHHLPASVDEKWRRPRAAN